MTLSTKSMTVITITNNKNLMASVLSCYKHDSFLCPRNHSIVPSQHYHTMIMSLSSYHRSITTPLSWYFHCTIARYHIILMTMSSYHRGIPHHSHDNVIVLSRHTTSFSWHCHRTNAAYHIILMTMSSYHRGILHHSRDIVIVPLRHYHTIIMTLS